MTASGITLNIHFTDLCKSIECADGSEMN